MTDDLEPNGTGPPDPPDPPSQEPWSAWWSWVVRFLGAAIMAQQAFLKEDDRQWLLLCAMGMMLGEIGLRALFRLLIRASGGGGQ